MERLWKTTQMMIWCVVLAVFWRTSITLAHFQQPRVLIALMVDNNADALPYSLFYLQQLDFPKSWISIWIHCSPSNDGSKKIVRKWAGRVRTIYQQVLVFCDDENAERKPQDAVKIRQVILHAALELNKDYVLFIGADNILEESSVLLDMLAEHKPIIAPLLMHPDDITEWFGDPGRPNFYTANMKHMERIWRRESFGCHWVERVHGTVLIDLYDMQLAKVEFLPRKDGDLDFASHRDGPGVYVLNRHVYGWLPVIEPGDEKLGKDFFNIIQDKQLQHLSYLDKRSYPEPSPIGFDEVYIINLIRRPDRKLRMENMMRSLGIKARIIEGVDGWTITNQTLEELGATTWIGYDNATEYDIHMNLGNVGCFISHYNIWKHAQENNYSKILILEDDLRPRPHFVKKVQALVREADEVPGGWDLLYVYREPLLEKPTSFPPQPEGTRWNKFDEPYVSENLVTPRYSYGGVAYILSASGLEKVLFGTPLQKMLPLDTWLPLLYGFTGLPEEIIEQYASRPRIRALASWPFLAGYFPINSARGYTSDTYYNPLEHEYRNV